MIVVIPCWRRPAHLAATLRTIERARLSKSRAYIFTIDRDPDPAVVDVVASFKLRAQTLAVIEQRNHPYHGPAFNILQGYASAVARAAPLEEIALIEDDILVASDVFEFLDEALALDPAAAGVSACRNQNTYAPQPGGAAGVYRHGSYQSLAVSLRRSFVERVLRHVTSDYFEDPSTYCLTHLPADLPGWAVSQDGLFHRVLKRLNGTMLFPCEPRACHVGWVGYNRRNGVDLVGDWRINAGRVLGLTTDQMNELADPRFRDIDRCELIRPQTRLKLV